MYFALYLPNFERMIGPFLLQVILLAVVAFAIIMYASQYRDYNSVVKGVLLGGTAASVMAFVWFFGAGVGTGDGSLQDSLLTFCELGFFAMSMGTGLLFSGVALAFWPRSQVTTGNRGDSNIGDDEQSGR